VAALGDIAIEGKEITGTFVGTVNDFDVDISATLYDSDVVVVGEVENITHIEALAAKADLDITTTPAKVDNIYRNITHTPLPAEAKEWTERFTTLALSGNAAIRPREVVADAELSTDLGNVAVDGTLHYAPSGFSFEGLIAGDALEAGKILKTEQLGKADITLKGAVEMTGGELEGDLTADVERIWWSGYDYNNLTMEGSLKDENFRQRPPRQIPTSPLRWRQTAPSTSKAPNTTSFSHSTGPTSVCWASPRARAPRGWQVVWRRHLKVAHSTIWWAAQ
jgi:hypothetical protein